MSQVRGLPKVSKRESLFWPALTGFSNDLEVAKIKARGAGNRSSQV